ncbi:MAG: hypothetical protein NUW07_05610 [Candidatus Saccharicenans sp.]|jgi:hypothetical protein|nr:hypothetical protein [Candidatus Saccharicenans sp.]MDH7492289.1 hypothetical protein [Candidatus Saccharicenans sp.]
MPEKSRLLTGISLVSATILALELILTRYFSITQGYHYAFLVVSIAFLGFGAGAIFLFSASLKNYLERDYLLSSLALALGLFILLSFFLVNRLSFNPVELLWNQKKLAVMPLHFLILSLPFLLGGLIISLALTRLAGVVHQVYFADLVGAAAGIIFSGLSFHLAGDRGAVRLLVGLALVAGWLFVRWSECRRTLKVAIILVSGLLLTLAFLPGDWLSFRISEYKPLPFYLKQKEAAVIKTMWDEKLRLDLFESPAVRYAPGLSLRFSGQLPHQRGLSLEAERIYALTEYSGRPGELDFLDYLPLSPAFESARGGQILLLKPGGDLELWLSLRAAPSAVTVFEESHLLRKIHEERQDLVDSIAASTVVNFSTIEARSGLSREKKRGRRFDLVVYSLPDLPGSFSTGFYGPGEDYLHTVEAAETVLDLLSPDGLAVALFYFLPPPRQELRFLALWIETLERRGLNPARHLLILRTIETITFFIKKQEFSEEEIRRWQTLASGRFYDLLVPGREAGSDRSAVIQTDDSSWEELVRTLFQPEKRPALYDNYLFDLRPPSDNRPFFGDFLKWSRWAEINRLFGQKIYPLFLSKYLLVFLLVQSLLIGLFLIILPLLRVGRRQLSALPGKSLIFGYFSSLGAGYMLVEITLFHKFILLLGHPTYSLSAVLFFLLGASGAGSLSLASLRKRIGQSGLVFWPLLCCLAIGLEIGAISLASGLFLRAGLMGRLLLSFGLIFPLGFCLGLPFPAGLNYFQSRTTLIVPFGFAANAFFSLLASVWSLVQAELWGYRSVFWLAVVFYLSSFIFFYLAHHRDKSHIQ